MRNTIPKFKNYAEEAKFWDTHDVTDYLGEMKFKDVEFLPRQKKEEKITFRLEQTLKERLKKMAHHQGLNISTLTRLWVIEKLRQT